MYNIKEHPISWRILLYFGDILAFFVSGILFFWVCRWVDANQELFSWLSRHLGAKTTPTLNFVTLFNGFFSYALLFYYFQRTGLYCSRSFLYRGPRIRRLIFSLLLFVTTYALMYALTTAGNTATVVYFISLYSVILFFTAYTFKELILLFEIRFLRSMRVGRVAFVGWSFRLGKAIKGLAGEVLLNKDILGYIADRSSDLIPPSELGYRELGTLENLSSILEKESITSFIVDQRTVSSDKLHQIEVVCADLMVTLKMIPWSSEIWTDRLVVEIVDGVPLLRVKELLHDRSHSKILRRIVDVFGSLIGLVLSAPVIGILVILIKREAPGSVFYRQTRLGLKNKPFEIIKLRSMRMDAERESGAIWAVENDTRRLKIGEFMRKWNLDELPQFWNVFKGEMSLVGPRPERPEFVEKFRDSLHYYNLRHSCKPGMTGWAAVHGLRGDTSLEDRLDFDLYYIEHWSLFLDFKIMLMTLIAQKNAY